MTVTDSDGFESQFLSQKDSLDKRRLEFVCSNNISFQKLSASSTKDLFFFKFFLLLLEKYVVMQAFLLCPNLTTLSNWQKRF